MIQTYSHAGSPLEKLCKDIELFLTQYSGQTILYHPNPGNAGDALIATGTYHAFARAGIKFKIIGLNDDVSGQTVFLSGGGNLVEYYDDIRSAYGRFLGQAKKIVLLPHTIRGHEDLLRTLDASCLVFCRDQESYDHVSAANPSLDTRLTHDMAFHIDLAKVIDASDANTSMKKYLHQRLLSKGFSERKMRSAHGVDMLRLDVESSVNAPVSDMDISATFPGGVVPDKAHASAWCFLKTISFARRINTDRLHVAIGAALLGVPCTLRSNSYSKNRAVFRHSLRDFPNLTFCEQYKRCYGVDDAARKVRLWHWFSVRFHQSLGKILYPRRIRI